MVSYIAADIQDESSSNLNKPKHLYDCLLGLRSENKERFTLSMKHLCYLIRKNLDDLDLLSKDLIIILLKLSDNTYDIDKYIEYREKAIISLIIMQPEKISMFNFNHFKILLNIYKDYS